MLDPQTPIATLVLDHSECAPVFERHRIDYCCKGRRPLAEVCAELGLDLGAVVGELELAIQRRTVPEIDPRTLSTRALITDVIGRHHRYLHRTLPFLQRQADKVARVHGDREPSLVDLAAIVSVLADTLAAHLAEEEQELFPALLAGEVSPRVAGMLATMTADHLEVGDLLARLRDVAVDFRPPAWACNSYRTLLLELAELESDTLRHVHVENHVLAPRFR